MIQTTSYSEFNICDKDLARNFERDTKEVVILPQNSEICKDMSVVDTRA